MADSESVAPKSSFPDSMAEESALSAPEHLPASAEESAFPESVAPKSHSPYLPRRPRNPYPPSRLLSDKAEVSIVSVTDEVKPKDFELMGKTVEVEADEDDEVKSKVFELKGKNVEVEADEDESDESESEEESDEDEEEPPVCQVCLKDKEHWTLMCPFLECIPDPQNTQVGFDYMIVCKCCHIRDGHPDRNNWVAKAVTDPLSVMFLSDPSNPTAKTTDLGSRDTVKALLGRDPEFRELLDSFRNRHRN